MNFQSGDVVESGQVLVVIDDSTDVADMHAAIRAFFRKGLVEAELFLPWSAQQLRGKIFASCEVLNERADDDGAFLRVRADAETLKGLQEQLGGKAVAG